MLAGHYAAGFVGKAAARSIPLWTLVLACQLVDVIHFVLLLLGIERTTLDATLPTNPLVIEHVPYTHSLLANAGWSALVFAIGWRWLRSRRAAAVLAVVTLSHWFLDVLMHRPDMTLHGGDPRLGLGLWNHPSVAHTVELVVLVTSVGLWLWRAPPTHKLRAFALVTVLCAVQLYAIVAPAPTQIHEIAVSGLVFFATVTALAAAAERPVR